MNSDAYVQEIARIDEELKRISVHTKQLREQKARASLGLYHYMKSKGLEEVNNGKGVITINKCAPKQKKPRQTKPKAQRRLDTLSLLRDVGIPNPEDFYNELENVQKGTPKNECETDDIFGNSVKTKRGRKKEKDTVDALLGF